MDTNVQIFKVPEYIRYVALLWWFQVQKTNWSGSNQELSPRISNCVSWRLSFQVSESEWRHTSYKNLELNILFVFFRVMTKALPNCVNNWVEWYLYWSDSRIPPKHVSFWCPFLTNSHCCNIPLKHVAVQIWRVATYVPQTSYSNTLELVNISTTVVLWSNVTDQLACCPWDKK